MAVGESIVGSVSLNRAVGGVSKKGEKRSTGRKGNLQRNNSKHHEKNKRMSASSD